jgi:hypothetical protein
MGGDAPKVWLAISSATVQGRQHLASRWKRRLCTVQIGQLTGVTASSVRHTGLCVDACKGRQGLGLNVRITRVYGMRAGDHLVVPGASDDDLCGRHFTAGCRATLRVLFAAHERQGGLA